MNLSDPRNQYLIDNFFPVHQTQVQGKGDPLQVSMMTKSAIIMIKAHAQ